MRKLIPLGDRVLVRRNEAPEKIGAIFVPDNAKEKPVEGEALMCGPGRLTENGFRVAMDVMPGDRIIFNKYAGTEVTIDGERYQLISEDDILGVFFGEP